MNQAILSLDNVSKFYTSSANVVVGLNSVSMDFHRGEFVAITGESGSGKSTLSSVVGGILPYESGELLISGNPTSHYDSAQWEVYRRDNISYISQSYGLLPGCSVWKNVMTALTLAGLKKGPAKKQARLLLEQVELWKYRHRRAARLSSGQKQRLSIARALAKPAPILIADEPTGNLDPENSAKVISLLAEAAKTRLVLLVTHEFSEVQDVATRHIRLQDGRVVLDAPLRPANDPEPLPQLRKAKNPTLSLGITRLQLGSRPIWSALMVVLFTLTAFAMFAFLGSFIIAMDDTSTRIYDDSTFLNGDPNRLVVSTLSGRPLTQKDHDAIVNVAHAVRLETNDYVADMQYAFQEGEGVTKVFTEVIIQGGPNDFESYSEQTYTYLVHEDAPYLQTVPVLPKDQEFLAEGELPNDFYTVVAHRDSGLKIGQWVPVFLINRDLWPKHVYLDLQFKVVGLTDYGSGLYFSQDMGHFVQQMQMGSHSKDYFQILPENVEFLTPYLVQTVGEGEAAHQVSRLLKPGECRIHPSNLTIPTHEAVDATVEVRVPNINLLREGLDPLGMGNWVILNTPLVTFEGIESRQQLPELGGHVKNDDSRAHEYSSFPRLMFVHPEDFKRLTWNESCEQASLTIADYAYTDEVIDALEGLGYVAASPYRLGSTQVDPEKAEVRMQTLLICLGAMIAIAALQIVLLRVMFSVETDSYQLLRNIGLMGRTAKRSIVWQFLYFTVLGQLFAAVAVLVCRHFEVAQILHVLQYLPKPYIALISAVHLAAAMLSAGWVCRALRKHVYAQTERFEDLKLDEEEVAA